MRNYETLKVWEKAHALVQDVYRATERFPHREMYGLTQQMRNAAASVPTNIVEGCGRQTEAELIHFLYVAMGSATEVHYQLRLSRDLGYLDAETHAALSSDATEVRQMGAGYIAYLKEVVRRGKTARRLPSNPPRRPSAKPEEAVQT